MGLSDWKLVYNGPRVVRWEHKKTANEIDVTYYYVSSKEPWDVGIPGVPSKQFKTKPEAVRHARRYMRTHRS